MRWGKCHVFVLARFGHRWGCDGNRRAVMKRVVFSSLALVATLAFVMVSYSRSGPSSDTEVNEVSRAEPLSQLGAPGLASTATTAPLNDTPDQERVLEKDPLPQDPVAASIQILTQGILEELKRPVHTGPAWQGAQDPSAPQSGVPQDLQAAVSRGLQATAPQAPGPQNPGTGLATYVVQEGDTLTGIASRLYGDASADLALIAANAGQLSSPSDLRTGMTLILPPRP